MLSDDSELNRIKVYICYFDTARNFFVTSNITGEGRGGFMLRICCEIFLM